MQKVIFQTIIICNLLFCILTSAQEKDSIKSSVEIENKIAKFLKKPLSYFLSDFDSLDQIAENFNIDFQSEVEKLEEQK